MKQYKMITRVLILLLVILWAIGITSCNKDEENSFITGSPNADPGYGYIINSTEYSLAVDVSERGDYQISIAPGGLNAIQLQPRTTHLIHVVMLDNSGRAVAEYVNSFYINEIALDNQVRDFICSWYVEITSTSGYTNNFGS